MRPFDRADQGLFKGRARETAALARKVRANRFTAVVGASGSGKSSLVRAGVLPDLAGDGWAAIIAKPGSAPVARLAAALAAAEGGDDPLAGAREYRYAADLRTSAYGLAELSRKIRPEAPSLVLVLVVDQFEELFRFGEEAKGAEQAAMREESRAFVELLLNAAAQPDGRLHIIVTLRSDFFGNCSAYAGLAEAIGDSQYLVPLPGRDDLERAIREPIAGRGGHIDDALVQRLLVDLEDQADRLPTLQHTLRRLWEEARDQPRHLTEALYLKIGRMAGSINSKAEDLCAAIQQREPGDLAVLGQVMKALTELDEQNRAIRRPQQHGELLALLSEGGGPDRAAALDRVLAAFASEDASYLLLSEGADPDVDISYEALIRSWRRLCGPNGNFAGGWLADERADGRRWRELASRAESRSLLSSTEWKRTRDWIRARHIGPAWSARYGDAWEAAGGLLRASFRRLGVGLALGLVATAVFSGLLFWGLMSHREAREQRAAAARFARAGALAAAGYARYVSDDGMARQSALVALGVLPENRAESDPSYLPEVEAALAHGLSLPTERLRFIGHENVVTAVAFSPDGRRVVSATEDQTLRLWDGGYAVASLTELARGAEALCPLSPRERQRLALTDPRFAADERPPTEEQKLACGRR